MNLGDKVLLNRQFDLLQRRSHGPGLAAGVDDLVGGDAIELSTEGSFLRVISGKRPENRKEDALG